MFRKMIAAAAVGLLLAGTPVMGDPPTPPQHDQKKKPAKGHDNKGHDAKHHDSKHHDNRNNHQGHNSNRYDEHGRYREPQRITRDSHVWRGSDGHYHCRRDNGTTGLLIGAGLGALAGNQISGNGDKTLGTLLGGALGGALGREIDRGSIQCR